MTPIDDDRRLLAWLDAERGVRAPDRVLAETLDRTRRLRPRPAWRVSERWLPVTTSLRLMIIPRWLPALLVLALLGALLLAVAGVGSPPPIPIEPLPLIAYAQDGDIWVIATDGSDAHSITAGPGYDDGVAWSPDGRRLAYFSWPAPADPNADPTTAAPGSLMLVDAAGGSPVTVLEGVWVGAGSAVVGPAWSLDGTRLAFDRLADAGGVPEVDVVDAAGGRPRTVVAVGEHPAWSPDGAALAYRRPGEGVHVVRVDGTGDLRLSHGYSAGGNESWAWPSWSPDGRSVAYSQAPTVGAGHEDLFLAAADGSGETSILAGPSSDTIPAWAPDGASIAFGRLEVDRKRYGVVAPDGTDLRLLPGPGWSDVTDWAPDGSRLLAFVIDDAHAGVGLGLWDPHGGEPDVLPIVGGHARWQPMHP